MKSIHPENLSITAASGSGSANTSPNAVGILRIISVKPATTPTYDIKITDLDGFAIYEAIGCVGEHAPEVALPFIRGVHTFTISNSTVDELFSIRLGIEE